MMSILLYFPFLCNNSYLLELNANGISAYLSRGSLNDAQLLIFLPPNGGTSWRSMFWRIFEEVTRRSDLVQ